MNTREERAEQRKTTLGLFTSKEVSGMFGLDERTMAVWRSKGVGPRYYKLGKSVFYKLADIDKWISDNAVETNASNKDHNPMLEFSIASYTPMDNDHVTGGATLSSE